MENWNTMIEQKGLNKWHKVDKGNFHAPQYSSTMMLFFSKGSIFCGYYSKSKGFVCYGIEKRELTDVDVTHWRNLDFPQEFQQFLDDRDNELLNVSNP